MENKTRAKAIRFKEPVSGFSHLVGAFLSLTALTVLVAMSVYRSTPWHTVSFSVYGTSMTLLYLASALYHLLPLNEKGTRLLKRFDHVMIFLMIAGTYTPFCLVPLRGAWGWSIFGVVWGLAAAGVFFKILWITAPRWFSTIIYLLMGWVCIVAIYPIVQTVPLGGVIWLASGGMLYSVGAVIYGMKKPNPWPGIFGFHEIWHFFVLGGSFCHFMAILLYILPMA
ncbi:PAQR family membrane homeostasis protein TrhA [Limisalsivibrio acetivorans]|uniref:PAQR family membrane homeostasis protein TrhA n=1 Tax=Limisalsivibrio acetivorans TaxID=1304888 RepID=UPI0003B7255E|nr:hemolysin III family protein [Limisalsivibrio acetivorans]